MNKSVPSVVDCPRDTGSLGKLSSAVLYRLAHQLGMFQNLTFYKGQSLSDQELEFIQKGLAEKAMLIAAKLCLRDAGLS